MASYEHWRIERWDTPIADIVSVAMASLVDSGGKLRITLEAPLESGRPRWEFVFDSYPGYRSLLEEFRLQLWGHLDETGQRCGNTFCVTNSPWIETLRKHEGVFAHYYPKIAHYVILTEDDVVEILSPEAPSVNALGSTPNDEARAGKSTVLYHPKDRGRLWEMFPHLKRGNDDE